MTRKNYLAPRMTEVHLTLTHKICEGTVGNVNDSSNLSLGGAGGAGNSARSNERQDNPIWDTKW